GEVGPGRDPELAERRARRHARERHRRLREVQALVQLALAQHDIDTTPEREPRRHLIGEGGLDIDRLENVLVAGEPPIEGQGPVGLESIRREYPDADAEL